MSEETEVKRINTKNINIGFAGMFLSIFFIPGCLYYCVHTFDFIISAGILTSLSVIIWGIFSLFWMGYWCNKK